MDKSREKWRTVGRPGYFGSARDARRAEWDAEYGKGNWRIAWKSGDSYVDFRGACALYEDAYYEFLKSNPEVLMRLVVEASEVYDTAPSNIKSGIDYMKQEGGRTHIQDIAIRRAMLRLGARFEGDAPIRIRDKDGTHKLSVVLSPGHVPFHKKQIIERPELDGWWQPHSAEAFYQSNKFLQARRIMPAARKS